MTEKTAKNGDTLKVNYTGKLENGEIFDTSIEEVAKEAGIFSPEREYQPLTIKLGFGQVIPGFEKALMGMKEGEKKEVVIPPEEGYGVEREELFAPVDMGLFREAGIVPEVGMLIETNMGIGRVHEVGENEVILNFNHPLAGKTLIFEIELVEIE